MINLWIVVYIPNDSQLWIVVFIYIYIYYSNYSGIIIGDSSGIFPIYPTMTSQNCFGNSVDENFSMELPKSHGSHGQSMAKSLNPILYVAI